ncbi:MAG: type II toxin-antitoxin system VapC family toxin [Candidatus Hydrogenedentes bacterium]|nr:type II toxin-antitoxin system VapC family toxin [Candidatus Hydrogenedentota bacterium]
MRAYLDSCIVIYLVEGALDLRRSVHDRIMASPDFTICTSCIVRLECLVGAIKRGDFELVDQYRRLLDATVSLSVTDDVCERAAELRAMHGLLVPDAVHLAIADTHKCDEFWTADTHFKPVTGLRHVRIRPIQ